MIQRCRRNAFRNIGHDRIASDIVKTMRTADFDIRESDPFEDRIDLILPARERETGHRTFCKVSWAPCF